MEISVVEIIKDVQYSLHEGNIIMAMLVKLDIHDGTMQWLWIMPKGNVVLTGRAKTKEDAANSVARFYEPLPKS